MGRKIIKLINVSVVLGLVVGGMWVAGSVLAREHMEGSMKHASATSALDKVAKKLIVLGEEDQRDRKKAMSPGFDKQALAVADERRKNTFLELTSGKLFGLSEVGVEAVTAEFLIIQHSQDRSFQSHMAKQMQCLVQKGDFPKEAYATFVDRQLVYDGKAQRYGTQANEAFELYPIEDEAAVDARRKDMGLPSIGEVRAKLQHAKAAVASGKGIGE